MFIIETLTNMHVGSGETHFGVVDNLIQRHPITKLPIIHSSGIKGALKQYFEDNNFNKEYIKELFGTDISLDTADSKKELDYGPGHLIFFEAQMLTLPLRASENVYYNCTSVPTIIEYLDQLDNFFNAKAKTNELRKWLGELDFQGNDFIFFEGSNNLEIEDYSNGKKIDKSSINGSINESIIRSLQDLCKIDINKLAIFEKDIFTHICTDSIPVIARNKIQDDGTSGNLFYEEILPRKTSLYMIIGYDAYLNKEDEGKEAKGEFEKIIGEDKKIYQFGANYSIGYGFSKLHKINV
jgi:CRISPR-associated protein Cmr4